MFSTTDSIKRGALVGVILVSTTLGANALTIARCNVLQDGVYRPALLVETNGDVVVHHIGEDGLTRSAVFNEEAALAWAAAHYGSSFEWNPRSDCNTQGNLGVVLAEGDDDDDQADYLNP